MTLRGCLTVCLMVLTCILSDVHCHDVTGFNTLFSTNKEEYTDFAIKFEKSLPSWLFGTLVRNGPGQFEMARRHFNHVFDGYAKLSSWKFPGNGSVLFSTKFLQTQTYRKSVAMEDIYPYVTFGTTDPPFTFRQILKSFKNGFDNMNVNIFNFSNTLVAVNDVWNFYEFDLPTLNVITPISTKMPSCNNMSNWGLLNMMSSAHPVKEYEKDSYISFVVGVSVIPMMKSRVTVVRITAAEKRETIACWHMVKASYMHSFAVTRNYAVFFAQPCYYDYFKMSETGSVAGGMYYEQNEPTTIYIVNIKTGKVDSIETNNVFVLHHINAYESSHSEIFVDVPAAKNPYAFKNFEINKLLNATSRKDLLMVTQTRRYIINLQSMSVRSVNFPTTSMDMELPTINENYRSMPYCYIYGIIINFDKKDFSHIAITKQDVCKNQPDKMFHIQNHYPSEAWFVPYPSTMARNEDDGYLMSVILDGEKNLSYIAMIDPKTMQLVNKAYLPTYIPFSTHGRFFDGL